MVTIYIREDLKILKPEIIVRLLIRIACNYVNFCEYTTLIFT